jgi:hypothetical protein
MRRVVVNSAHACRDIVAAILPLFRDTQEEDDVDFRLVTQDGIWMEPSKKISEYLQKLTKKGIVELRRKSRTRRAESVANLHGAMSVGKPVKVCKSLIENRLYG